MEDMVLEKNQHLSNNVWYNMENGWNTDEYCNISNNNRKAW